MVRQAYNAPASIWSAIKVSLSNVRSSEISSKTSNTSSSLQSASPGKILNLWYLVDLDLLIFKYFPRRKYSPVETVMMMMMINCFCGMVDRRKVFSLISSRDHYQRSSPSRISDTPWAGFEPAQNLSSGLVEWSCAAVITTTSYPSVSSFSSILFSSTFKIYTRSFASSDTNAANDGIVNSNTFSFWSILSASRSHSSSWQTNPTGGINSLLVSDNFKQLTKSKCRHCKQSQRYSRHNNFLLPGL